VWQYQTAPRCALAADLFDSRDGWGVFGKPKQWKQETFSCRLVLPDSVSFLGLPSRMNWNLGLPSRMNWNLVYISQTIFLPDKRFYRVNRLRGQQFYKVALIRHQKHFGVNLCPQRFYKRECDALPNASMERTIAGSPLPVIGTTRQWSAPLVRTKSMFKFRG
jgi:hypothetical protein